MCWQVRGKYDTIEAMLYKETGQYGKQIGDFFWFHAWSTFPLEGVLEAAIQRQKTELDRVGADYKEAAGFRLNQLFCRDSNSFAMLYLHFLKYLVGMYD